jgi:hypothetical protein
LPGNDGTAACAYRRRNDPEETRKKRKFVQDGQAITAYCATGNMLVNGKKIRTCSLQLAPL